MRRWILLLLAAAAAWASASIGCSGVTSFVLPPVDAGPVATRYASACAAWAAAVCAHESLCQIDASYGIYPWTSPDQCIQRSTVICEVVATDPNVVIDAEELSQCQYSDDCDAAVRELPLDCLPHGRSPAGAPCVFNEACASNECLVTSSTCGVCAPTPHPCVCPSGEVCVGIGTDGGSVCDKLAGIDGGCSSQAQCQFYCSFAVPPPPSTGAGSAPTGTCVSQPALGMPCTPPDELGPPCAGDNTYCDPSGHCSLIQGVGYGQACGAPEAGVEGPDLFCVGGGTCDPTVNVCIPPSADGQVCDETQMLGCLTPARCIADRCLYPSLSYCGL